MRVKTTDTANDAAPASATSDINFKKLKKWAIQLFMTYIFAVIGVARWVHRKVLSFLVSEIPRGTILRDVVDFGPLPGYPFKPNYVDLPQGVRMHYVDECEPQNTSKEVVVCLHGEPTWSYLYRKMVPVLTRAGHRVVCPDFIGFGKSDKFASLNDYTHAMHVDSLKFLFEHLDLDNVTLVVQDWGGLTGLSALPDISERVSRLVIMNTGLPPISRGPISSGANFITWRTFAWMCHTEVPVKTVMKASCKGISEEEVAAYAKPFPTSIHRAGVAKWPLMVPLTSHFEAEPYMRRAHSHLKEWTKPALVMFSDKCPVTAGIDAYFTHVIPTSGFEPGCTAPITIHKAGHFLQEDKGEELAENIVKFMADTKE